MCCLVYSPLGPDNVSRHLLTRPGRHSARAAYLQPALRRVAFDTAEATIRVTEPGASAAPESTRALPVTAGSDGGSRGRRLRVYAHDPRHVAAAVPWYHCGSDGHGADSSGGAGGPRKERTVPESNRVCVI